MARRILLVASCYFVVSAGEESCDAVTSLPQAKPTRGRALVQSSTMESVVSGHAVEAPKHLSTTGLLLFEMQELIRSKGKHGISSKEKEHMQSIIDLIENSIKPSIFDGVHEMLEELNDLYQAVLDCQEQVTTQLHHIVSLQEDSETKKKEHWECREQEEEVYKGQTRICTEFEEFRSGIHVPESMPDLGVANAQISQWLHQMSDYFCPLYEVYIEKWEECENNTKTITEIRERCTLNQEEFEQDLCTLRVEVTEVCESYNTCWTEAVTRYNERKQAIMKVLKDRQEEYIASERVECLWTTWQGDDPCVVNETQVRECEEQPVNITNLTFPFPELPDPVTCDTSVVSEYPCSEEFIREEYLILDLDPAIVHEIVSSCQECIDEHNTDEDSTESSEVAWTLHNIERTALNAFMKTGGQNDAWDANAYTTYAEIQMITFAISSDGKHARLGLTPFAADSSDYENGYHITLTPELQLFISGGPTSTYMRDDTIKFTIAESIVQVSKNDQLLHTWNDAPQSAMHAKIFLYEVGNSVQVTDFIRATPPVKYDLTASGLGIPVQVDEPCGEANCDRVLTASESLAKAICEEEGGQVTLCGCIQILCSMQVDVPEVATTQVPTTSTSQAAQPDEACEVYFEQGVKYNLYDLGIGGPEINSVALCQSACQHMPTCTHFSFTDNLNSGGASCLLKHLPLGESFEKSQVAGYTSGPKECSPVDEEELPTSDIGDMIFGIGPDNAVYRQQLELMTANTSWIKVSTGTVLAMAISEGEVYAVGEDKKVYHQALAHMTISSPWRLAYPGFVIAIAFDRDHIYGIGEDHKLYSNDITTMFPTSSPWTLASNQIMTAIAIQGDTIYAVGLNDQSIYSQSLPDMTTETGWTRLSAGYVKAAVSARGLMYAIGMDNRIYSQPLTEMSTTTVWGTPASSGFVTGIAVWKDACAGMEEDTWYEGYDVPSQSATRADTVYQCQVACKISPVCTHFSFVPEQPGEGDGPACALKQIESLSEEMKRQIPGFTSGPKECPTASALMQTIKTSSQQTELMQDMRRKSVPAEQMTKVRH